MNDLLPRVRQYIRRHELFRPGETVVVGVSGGPDSLCLLHLLQRLAPELALGLHVAHLNHGLRGPEADADAAFVTDLAAAWGLSFSLAKINVAALAEKGGLSLEEAARHARYAFLAEVAGAIGASAIAVGHNADDQAETVLMHFLRGSGVAGLRGMLPRSPLGDYRLSGMADSTLLRSTADREVSTPHSTPPPQCSLTLVRPLLAVSRAEVEAYCVVHGLTPRFDRSNEDTTFYRNRLRHELLPFLATYNPAIREVLTRTAEVMAGDFEILQTALAEAWAAVAVPAPPGEVRFDLAGWRRLPIGLQRATVREAVHRLRWSLRNINWEHVDRAVWLGREGSTGQSATLAAGLALAVGYGALRIADEGTSWTDDMPQVTAPLHLPVVGTVELPGGWFVTVRKLAASELPAGWDENRDPWTAWLDAGAVGDELILRPRQPGERFRPHGLGGHSTRVNEFMINLKVPRGVRAGWPLLTGKEGIAWVCGLRLDEHALVRPDTRWVWEVRIARRAG
ncbi:MAG: tRNA lysidine(34) synthetase TilS [Anaerolineae bacterium]|nr:tRNA lysidine(34) synthetase TilS [Anaerolineae bacterium]